MHLISFASARLQQRTSSIGRFVLIAILSVAFTQVSVAQDGLVGDRAIKMTTWEGNTYEYVDGEIIIKLAPSTMPDHVRPLLSQHGGRLALSKEDLIEKFETKYKRSKLDVDAKRRIAEYIWNRPWKAVRLPEGRNIVPVMEALQKSPLIENATPNQVVVGADMSSNSHSEGKNDGSNEGSVNVDRGTNSGVYPHEPTRPLERMRPIGSETGTPSTDHTPLPFLSATANAQEPNDPYFQGTGPTTFNHQWGLKNTGQTPPGATRADSDIDAEVAWGFETGDYGTVIAIIDTGIPLESDDNVWDSFDLSHPDLDNFNKVALGSDWTNTGKGVRDDNGHGTHVAGIAGAETDNGVGASGVCWDCQLYIVKSLERDRGGDLVDAIKGINEAIAYSKEAVVDNMVINLSWETKDGTGNDNLEEVIADAGSEGILVVAGSGNDGGSVGFPAAYASTMLHVIAVGASNHNDDPVSYSNHGTEIVVAAPGGDGGSLNEDDIFSTYPDYEDFYLRNNAGVSMNYGYNWGTSMAAPFVSGTAALMWEREKTLSPSDIRQILIDTAEEGWTDPGPDEFFGHGRINAGKAVEKAVDPEAPNLEMTNAGQANQNPQLDWTDNTEPDFDDYKVYRCASYYSSCSWTHLGDVTSSDYTDYGVMISGDGDGDDEYVYHVKAVDTDGYDSDQSNWVSTWGTTPQLRGPATSEDPVLPEDFGLDASVPNPVRTQATIRYALPEASDVTLTVDDVMGREVKRLVDGAMPLGFHEVQMDTSDLPSGTYLYRLRAGRGFSE